MIERDRSLVDVGHWSTWVTANRSASRMSSAVSCGYSSRSSSLVVPSATIRTIIATGMRVPRMHGTPPVIWGSTLIRWKAVETRYGTGVRGPRATP